MMQSKKRLATYVALTLTAVSVMFVGWHWLAEHAASSRSDIVVPTIREAFRADTITDVYRQHVANELKYYLDRHNVQDEGFEMVASFAEGKRYAADSAELIPIWNVGRWRNHPWKGTRVCRDLSGRIIIGSWDSDTLTSGVRIDSLGTYRGEFVYGLASGHGSYSSVDGSYYEGHWVEDSRNGFGLRLTRDKEGVPRLSVGEWKNDRFLGERLNYTSERIYGIDISRYQHGKGRKKYPIEWNKVRVTHLGSLSRKRISGTVDYPVSFCYIKSTEGVSIRNPYFATDYAGARRHGIKTGAYHFFSTKRSGSSQAQFFLRNTRFSKGDLPPVLDVEPSQKQIAAMGGTSVLFSNIRAWMNVVERQVGVRPILYVSQSFVNKYLAEAPDLKRNYSVWIARYGEYKPDVKLMFWQLCPDGRVRGIRGDVDINVFNGYKSQFDEIR